MARDAEIRLRIDDRDVDKDSRRAKGKLRKELTSIGREVGRSVRGAFTGALDLAGVGSLGALAVAARKVYGFQDSLVRLQISAGKSKGSMRDLEKAFFAVGKAKGVDPDELLAGAKAFTGLTGDLNTYTEGMAALAQTATATGASMEDLSKVSAALKTNMGIGGGQFGTAFDILAAQGKAGAVELNELATELAGLTPRFATFGKTGVAGLSELGALLQNVRGGFGSTAEAATGLESLMGSLVANAGKFKKQGIKVFDKGQLRPLADIIFDIGDSKLFKSPTKLIDTLGRKEAYSALLQIVNQGRDSFTRLADSQAAAGTVARDFNTYMESTAGKTKSAQAALAEVFNEQLRDHLDGIAGALKMIAKLVGWIGEHPIAATALFAAGRFGPGVLGAVLGGGGGGAGGAAGVAESVAGAAGSAAGVAGAGKGMLLLAAKAGAVAAAGAAGLALGHWLDEKTGLSTRLANLARGEGFSSKRWESEGEREDRMLAEVRRRDETKQMQGRIAELQSLGYTGSTSPENVAKVYGGQDISRLRQSAAAARALGVSDAEIQRRGSDELMRQFPLALGPEGMELDTEKARAAQASTPLARQFSRAYGSMRGPVQAPVALPVDVRVVVSFEGDKPMAQVISDSKTHRMR